MHHITFIIRYIGTNYDYTHYFQVNNKRLYCLAIFWFLGKIWINMKETYTLIASQASGKTQELLAQLIRHDGGWVVG